MAYAHVPGAYEVAVLDQIERVGAALRERVVPSAILPPAELDGRQPQLRRRRQHHRGPSQTAIRPRLALDPYSTSVPGMYICSAATLPGGGVRGSGFNRRPVGAAVSARAVAYPEWTNRALVV
jgi:phytoene dehydrogenase-like protein